MNFSHLSLDHVGIRVTDLAVSERFYVKFGFIRDPEEYAPAVKACGLHHPSGLRLHLIFNGVSDPAGNVLMDVPVKYPGYTHAAFIIESMVGFVVWLEQERITITEGPVHMGHDRRVVCFIRDPDGNVLEFNEILK
ncbi:VOC family protein [Gluconacetobacter aggeris]|uniref:VOC family protein n=1 Tax=Gluconacetobacter aggeris TaxID=1286186 RepID=A0A7W4IWI3_9PROT|nr:VOC family protein [Gluconacetobacter aggeris]MBB2170374.1 VOC family protein [Gluconacetobacter aggeris]